MTRTKEQRPTTSFDLERARDVEKAMSPLPWFVLEDAHGEMIIIRNPNHPIHIDNLAAQGKRDEANTPDAIGITYMRENFSNLIAEIERLRAIIDTPPEESEWKSDLEVLDIATQSSTIDIEIAKKWHSAYRKAQNSNLLRKQENELLRESLVEHEEHENQTHEVLGIILGTDDTLENVAKRAAVRINELKADLEKYETVLDARLNVMVWQAARIKELENALVKELAKRRHPRAFPERISGSIDDAVIVRAQDEARDEDRQQLIAEGKIGPDAKPRVWQITEDRVTAIDQGLRFLEWSNAKTGNVETKKRIAILKTMLEEASDEHGFER
jgi:hypothetical protein